MSKPANTTLIGIFVFGGIVLATIAIGLFGSGGFNNEKRTFIAYFSDSVNGLDIGSPVKFRGVTIGKVSKVLIRTEDQLEDDHSVPVIIEIEKKLLDGRGVEEQFSALDERNKFIDKGVRAQLQQLSIVTGMLYVELNYHHGSVARFHKKNPAEGIREIPTLDSNLGTLMRGVTQTLEQVSKIKFAAIADKTEHLITTLDDGVSKIDFERINKGLSGIVTSADTLLKNEDLRKIPANLNGAITDFRQLSEKLTAKIDPVSDEFRKTTEQSVATLKRLEQVAENLRLATQPGSSLNIELAGMINQVSDAAQSFKTLMDYLKRHPNAVIAGKPEDSDSSNVEKKKK